MGDLLTDNPLQSADRDQKRNACCGRETARCRIEMYSGIAQSSLRLRGILLPNESLRPITSYLEYLQAWNLWNFSKSWSARRQSLTGETNRKSIRSRTNHTESLPNHGLSLNQTDFSLLPVLIGLNLRSTRTHDSDLPREATFILP